MGQGYSFRIEGREHPIAQDEWVSFCDRRSDLAADVTVEAIGRRALWMRVGRPDTSVEWCEPGIVFVDIRVEEMDDIDDMVDLASALGGEVRGESGEIYRSGGVVDS